MDQSDAVGAIAVEYLAVGAALLTILALSERANQQAQRRHKTTVDWTVQAVKVITHWLGGRCWTLLGDGA